MKCPESILVTVVYNGNQLDFDVPTSMPISELKAHIVKVLNMYYKQNNVNITIPEAVNLYYGNIALSNEKILINYGVWDGSILSLR